MHYPRGNICEYTSGIIKGISLDEIIIDHSCQSQPGSSGSPIINLINHKVIGIHKGSIKNGNCNVGIFLKKVINDFNINPKKEMNNSTNISFSYLEIEKINIISYENEDKDDFEILNDMYKKFFLKNQIHFLIKRKIMKRLNH